MLDDKQVILKLAEMLHQEFGGACMMGIDCGMKRTCMYANKGGSPVCFISAAVLEMGPQAMVDEAGQIDDTMLDYVYENEQPEKLGSVESLFEKTTGAIA